MRKEYNLDEMKSKPNPYARKLKKAVSLRIDEDVLEYFKKISTESGIPYQTLINFYLQDCMLSSKKLNIKWVA